MIGLAISIFGNRVGSRDVNYNNLYNRVGSRDVNYNNLYNSIGIRNKVHEARYRSIYIYIYINTGAGCNAANSAQYFRNRARISLESIKHYVFITLQVYRMFQVSLHQY